MDAKRGVLYITTGDNDSSPATSTSDAFIALKMNDGAIAWAKQILQPAGIGAASRGFDGRDIPSGLDVGERGVIVNRP